MGTDSRSLVLFVGPIVRLWGELVSQATIGKRRLRCKPILLRVVGDPSSSLNTLVNLLVGIEISIDDFFTEWPSVRLDRLVGGDYVSPAMEAPRLCQYRLRSLSIFPRQCREERES